MNKLSALMIGAAMVLGTAFAAQNAAPKSEPTTTTKAAKSTKSTKKHAKKVKKTSKTGTPASSTAPAPAPTK